MPDILKMISLPFWQTKTNYSLFCKASRSSIALLISEKEEEKAVTNIIRQWCLNTSAFSTLPKMKTLTLFIHVMGFTLPEIKTPVHPNAGSEIQSCVGMLNYISYGVNL